MAGSQLMARLLAARFGTTRSSSAIMPGLASALGRGLPKRSGIEFGHGLGRSLAVAAGFLPPLAARDDQPRLFRVETEIARIPWFNQSASGEEDRCSSGNEPALIAVYHCADPLVDDRSHKAMPRRWSAKTIAK